MQYFETVYTNATNLLSHFPVIVQQTRNPIQFQLHNSNTWVGPLLMISYGQIKGNSNVYLKKLLAAKRVYLICINYIYQFAHGYGGPQGTAANKCILVQTNICGCKQIYIDTKRIKHYVKLWDIDQMKPLSATVVLFIHSELSPFYGIIREDDKIFALWF